MLPFAADVHGGHRVFPALCKQDFEMIAIVTFFDLRYQTRFLKIRNNLTLLPYRFCTS